jgi:hypothetical protein
MHHGLSNGNGGVTFPTPPSTAGMQSQMAGRGGGSEGDGVDSEQQTPNPTDLEDTAKREGQSEDHEMTDTPQVPDQISQHRPTNHERNENTTADPTPAHPTPISTQKLPTERKYPPYLHIKCDVC